MKLNLLKSLFFLCVLVTNSATAQTTVYTETFTGSLPAGWQNIDQSGTGAGKWKWTTGAPLNWGNNGFGGTRPQMTTSSTGYMLFDSNGQNSGTNDGKVEKADLISPAINLTGKTSTALQFEHFTYHVFSDTVSVWVSTDGTSFTQMWSCFGGCDGDFNTGQGVTQNIDISSVADNQATVYIKFRWVGNYDLHWSIDDIKVTANLATGVLNNTAEANDLIIYSNPVKSELRFSLKQNGSNKFNVTISDITGKVCKTTNYQAGENLIDVKDLAPGLYFLTVLQGSSVSVKKFIKE